MYDTIMLAADHIGRNPDSFNFNFGTVPPSPHCGSPGCALGWIASFGGIKRFSDIDVVAEAMGTTEAIFYQRMDQLDPTDEWYDDAAVCASTLAKYAEEYHGHEKTFQLKEAA